jgi:hypothetical protein
LFLAGDNLAEVASSFSITVHYSVIETTEYFPRAEKLHNYATPASFLDFIRLIESLIKTKIREINQVKSFMEAGSASFQLLRMIELFHFTFQLSKMMKLTFKFIHLSTNKKKNYH